MCACVCILLRGSCGSPFLVTVKADEVAEYLLGEGGEREILCNIYRS